MTTKCHGGRTGACMATGVDPAVVSATIQEFGGRRYYLCGNYFQREGRRLHVAVWEAKHGKRPVGHEIHHADENRCNNRLCNLECRPRSEHRSLHSKALWATSPRYRQNIRKAVEAARAWHSSPAGRALHRRNGALTVARAAANPIVKNCEQCSREFPDRTISRIARFCSRNCYARHWRRTHHG